jgi:ATP-dependent DNA ligase
MRDHRKRHRPLEQQPAQPPDGHALYGAVCERSLEGVVAKWRRRASYRPGQGGWIKVKNPGYWRRPAEMAAMRRTLA